MIDKTKFIFIIHPGTLASNQRYKYIGAETLIRRWEVSGLRYKVDYYGSLAIVEQLPHSTTIHLRPDPSGEYDLDKRILEHLLESL